MAGFGILWVGEVSLAVSEHRIQQVALAKHAPRPLKRLYDRRTELMEAFRRAYFTEGRGAKAGTKE